MSYTRDRDYLTRGVGAIAATDASVARQRRHAHLVRATQKRDRAMAKVARGALGFITSGTFTEGGSYSPPHPTDLEYIPKAATGVTTVVAMPPTPAPAPAPAPAPPTVTAGGATPWRPGVSMGPFPVVSPLPPIPVLDGGFVQAPVQAQDNTLRNVAIAAAAAGAVYLLFLRGKS